MSGGVPARPGLAGPRPARAPARILVVRAPWTAVPALSLAFWALNAWWPLPGRGRAVGAGLVAFGLLALLRLLPKHEVPPPHGWRPPQAPAPPPRPGLPPPRIASGASLLVVAVALALMVLLPLWHHAPGPRLAFQTTTARLLVWRDGIPATTEPLLTLAPVGAHAPALATLAADVSQLSGLDPAGSMLLVVVAAAGLLLVGLFALHATWAPPWVAALGAAAALGAMPWPAALSAWGDGEALLALGLALPAVALVVGHVSRSSAVAAGLLLAAAALCQPLLCALLLAALALGRRGGAGRLALACVLALVLAGPGLWPLARALSAREGMALARAVRPGELVALAVGLALAASFPLALVRLAEPRSRGRPTRAGRPGRLRCGPPERPPPRLGGLRPAPRGPARGPGARFRRNPSPRRPVCAGRAARLGARPGRPGGGPARALGSTGLRRGVGGAGRSPLLAPPGGVHFHPVTTFDDRTRNHQPSERTMERTGERDAVDVVTARPG